MRRYFMTIPEACQLVLQAAAMGQGKEIFILDMGEPVRIVDLAEDLVRLSGLALEDVEIRFTGVRPGEKLFEELSVADEHADKTRHPKIFVGRQRPVPLEDIEKPLIAARSAIESNDENAIRHALSLLVPEYRPHPRTESPGAASAGSEAKSSPGRNTAPLPTARDVT